MIDATTNSLVATILLDGGAGNTVYDPGSGRILVAVHEKNELVAIDPATAKIVGHYPVPGIESPHGIALDVSARLAFVAGEENNKLAVVDLTNMKVLARYPVGKDPDVLAFDTGLKQFYVSAESGNVTVFRENGKTLVTVGSFSILTRTQFLSTRTPICLFPSTKYRRPSSLADYGAEPNEVILCDSLVRRPSPAPCRSTLPRRGRREREQPGRNGRSLSGPFRNTRQCAPLWQSEFWREACSDQHHLAGTR